MNAIDPIEQVLREYKTIAIVGATNNTTRPVYRVAKYLQANGFKIIPVNPAITEFLGEKSYPDVSAIPGEVEVVDIFRNPEAVPEIVEQAIAKRAKVVWMQPGAENWDAADRARSAGLEVVVGLCTMKLHRELQTQEP